MKHLKQTLLITLCLSFFLFSFSALAERDKPLIGIIQIVEHPALDAARQGFVDALKDNGKADGEQITIDYRNAQGASDVLASIADHFVASQADLVLAIATPSAQAMAGKSETIPIIGTAITDYVTAGLAKTNEEPGYNVSGTTDMANIDEQLALIPRFVPDIKTVGLIYTASEDNSVVQARIAKDLIENKMGLRYEEVTVHSTNDVQQAMLSLIDRCDAVYIPTDNILASAMSVVYDVTVPAKMPVFCGDTGMVLTGGVATLGLDYYKLGYQSGLMALKVMEGTPIGTLPIEYQSDFDYVVNKTVTDAIGLTIPEDLLPYAQEPGAPVAK